MTDLPHLVSGIPEFIPNAEVVVFESARSFFEQSDSGVDVLVYSAEAGSAWILLYPQFSVAVPQPDVIRIPIGFPVAPGDDRMRIFMNTWIELKRSNGTLDELYDTWILGRSPETTARR